MFLFFKRYANDPRALKLTQDYLDDAKRGTLPNVSFMVPSFVNHLDEHPPANVQTGMDLQQQTITALMRSPLWKSASTSTPTTSTVASSSTSARRSSMRMAWA